MLPRSLNHIAKSSTSCTKRISVSSLPAFSRSFVHPSRTDRAAVIDLPIRTSSHPPGTFSIYPPLLAPFLILLSSTRPSLQARPTTTPTTTKLASQPNLPRCPGPLFTLPQTTRNAHPNPFPQATTPMDPRVLDAMAPFFTDMYGNPHSRTHAYGWEAEHAVDEARRVSPPSFRPLSRA